MPGGHGTVANNGDHLAVILLQIFGCSHAQAVGDGGGTVTAFHHIIFAFRTFRKTADTLILAQGVKLIPAPGDQFMGIALMAHIPDQFIFGGIKT